MVVLSCSALHSPRCGALHGRLATGEYPMHSPAGTDRNSDHIPGPVPERSSGDNSGPADFLAGPVFFGPADLTFGRAGIFRSGKCLHASVRAGVI